MRNASTTSVRWLLAVSLIAAIAVGGLIWQGAVGQNQSNADQAAAIAQAKNLSRAFRSAAERVMPTVVKITAKTKPRRVAPSESPAPGENPFRGTPFEDFFEDHGFDAPHGFRMPEGMPRRQGVGSGVVIDAKGIILTNNHVVAGSDEIIVEIDGRQYRATDVKTDERTDLAVLRIEVDEPLVAAELGDSDVLEIGDWVIAVGNPFELEGTVSAGIISSKGRALGPNKRTNYLQTDAAINPGNSGGPLVNLDGQVVGINTAIASSNGAYQGVGFAIPSNLAKWVTDQLIQRGSVQRAYLGVSIGKIDGELARQLGVEANRGVLVSEVFADTPAAKAGFAAGDVILNFAGHPVNSPRELQEIVERSAAGSKQQVDVIRDGKRQALQVVVRPLPKDFGLASGTVRPRRGPDEDSPAFKSGDLGLEVDELSEDVAKRLGYTGFSGVLVIAADEAGIAADAGIRTGDLILRVGKKPVKSVDEFKAAVDGEALEDGILLLIRSREGNRFVVLQAL